METEPYHAQTQVWPNTGRHIMASYDDDSVVVYQAYNAAIGHHAAAHGSFGGPFSYERMSWIKPNFLWMMYRSGWGTKPNQEVTLAVRIPRPFFDELLRVAVPSSFEASRFETHHEWKDAVADSDVRLQWDPDHGPKGERLDRRAIQLGLRGDALRRYGQEEPIDVSDISEFVSEQRERALAPGAPELETPRERPYVPADPTIAAALGLDVA